MICGGAAVKMVALLFFFVIPITLGLRSKWVYSILFVFILMAAANICIVSEIAQLSDDLF